MAKAKVQDLVVRLLADSGQYTAALNDGTSAAKNFQKSTDKYIGSASTSYIKAFKGMTAVAAGLVVGMVALFKSQNEAIDQMAKFSDKVGLTTKELGRLTHAAELTGVGASNLQTSMQRMTRRISEAAQGAGAAKGAIEELGLSAEELGRMTPEAQLNALADAFQNVENQGDKVRLSVKLFDTAGADMVNMLANGSEGLKEMSDEADSLGLAFSRIDAAKVEEANDQLYRANAAIKGMAQTLTVTFAPAINQLAGYLVDVAKSLKLYNDQIKVFGAAQASYNFAFGIELEEQMKRASEEVAHYQQELERYSGVDIDSLYKFNPIPGGLSLSEFERLNKMLEEAAQRLQDYTDKYKDLNTVETKPIGNTDSSGDSSGSNEASTSNEFVYTIEPKIDINQESLDIALAEMNEELALALGSSLEELQMINSEAFQTDLEELADWGAIRLQTTEDVYNNLRKKAKKHLIDQKKLKKEECKSEKILLSCKEKSLLSQLDMMANFMRTSDGQSKKMFQLGKTAAIASATVAGIESTVTSFREGSKHGGPYLGAAYAAIAAAFAVTQIQQLASTSFGGSGGESMTSASSGTSSVPGAGSSDYVDISPDLPSEMKDEKESGSGVTIFIQGDVLDGDQFEEKVVSAFSNAVNHRNYSPIDSNSRQAYALRG